MASVLHGCARTTPRVRAELQASQASTRALAARYGLNPKTVAKWRKRDSVEDAPMGPKVRRSSVLSAEDEAKIAELRRSAMLPLDDLLGRLRESVPKLSRSALHRCLQREGISRLPRPEGVSKRGTFSETEIGYLHVDAAELRTAEGKVQLFLAVDRVTKLLHVELRDSVKMADGAAFMAGAVEAFPYAIHTVLTDNGAAFTHQPRYRAGATATHSPHVFDRVCRAHGVKHRLTKPYHPWTNGQAKEDGPHPQGGDREELPVRHEGRPRGAPQGLRRRAQPRQAPKVLAMAHPLPGDLRRLEEGPHPIQGRSAPPHPGTIHLARRRSRPKRGVGAKWPFGGVAH